MEKTWQLQEAKARFSELFSLSQNQGPQRISRLGKENSILIRESEYLSIIRGGQSLVDYLFSAPKADLIIERSRDSGRPLEL